MVNTDFSKLETLHTGRDGIFQTFPSAFGPDLSLVPEPIGGGKGLR